MNNEIITETANTPLQFIHNSHIFIHKKLTFPRILHNVNSKLNNITGTNLPRGRLFCAFTETLVVDKCAIATFCILQVELIAQHTQYLCSDKIR